MVSFFFFLSIFIFENYIKGVYIASGNKNLYSAVEKYQLSQNPGRSTYLNQNDFNNENKVKILLNITFKYFTKPWPQDISSNRDLLLFLINFFKLFIILVIIKKIFFQEYIIKDKNFLLFFMLIFFGIEIIWSLGTTSWGSASRHQIISLSILLLSLSLILKKTKNE